jgi:hypothetical protein
MAEHKIEGGNMLLFIDPNGGTAYDIVVCLTSVSKSDSVTVVDASSACGPDKSPGTIELSYAFEGQHLQDPDSGKISGTDLRILLRAEQTIGWKIAPETPVAGDEIESGTGFLSELSSTYAFDSVGTFTGSIQPYGTPSLSIFAAGLTISANNANPLTYDVGDVLSVPLIIGTATGGNPPYTYYFTDLFDVDSTSYIASLFSGGFDDNDASVSGTVVGGTLGVEEYRLHVVDSASNDTFVQIDFNITA